jgi:hypothetical protein
MPDLLGVPSMVGSILALDWWLQLIEFVVLIGEAIRPN